MTKKVLRLRLLQVCAVASVVAAVGITVHREQGRTSASPLDPVHVAAKDGTTTTSDVELADRSYRPGQCVDWDQSEKASGERATHVVDCSVPHLFEVAKDEVRVDRAISTAPTDEEWHQIIERQCTPLANEYLGGSLDPEGRYTASAIYPLEESWIAGDRTMTCGVQLRGGSFAAGNDDPLAPSTGAVRDVDQSWTLPVGTCWRKESDRRGTVPCDQPYTYEVVGTVDLRGRTSRPSTDAQWQSAIGDHCDDRARETLHHTVADDHIGWLILSQASWDAGSRLVTCTVQPGA